MVGDAKQAADFVEVGLQIGGRMPAQFVQTLFEVLQNQRFRPHFRLQTQQHMTHGDVWFNKAESLQVELLEPGFAPGDAGPERFERLGRGGRGPWGGGRGP